jgi:hypothetical protein
MKQLHIKFIKWLSKTSGYKVALLKTDGEIVTGDEDFLRYVDVNGYTSKQEPLKRVAEAPQPTSFAPLSPDQLKDLGAILNNQNAK